ncbi:GNAT family N-acetyltransferase [Variovorax sp. V213]|uniref:GNAT family N-acetyltransferase n=1 Tax=Variovorax sp. V213 TaxID=3065955 RepID=UPI0034E886B4
MFDSYTQDADVARYMVWRPHSFLETTREFIADCVAQWDAGTALPYVVALKSSGQLIGMLDARLHGHIVNIGYVLARNQWGQGLMVEAVRAFTAHALGVPGIFRVEAICDVDNRSLLPEHWRKVASCRRAALPATRSIRTSPLNHATALSTQRAGCSDRQNAVLITRGQRSLYLNALPSSGEAVLILLSRDRANLHRDAFAERHACLKER